MIELKENIITITIPPDKDKSIVHEIIDFVDSKLNSHRGKAILSAIEKYHKIDKDFKFNREDIYNERLHIH
ncbi:MAG: hypothetical protein ABRQ38_10500 [Candidatus Eremiobacterota bacterium]